MNGGRNEGRGGAGGATGGAMGRAGAGVNTGAAGDIAGAAVAATATGVGGGAAAAAPAAAPFTGKTALHTLQRARTPAAGTLAGSTRKTVSHVGQVTFTRCYPSPPLGRGSWRRSTTNTEPGCVFA
jgi:hypothetical protein